MLACDVFEKSELLQVKDKQSFTDTWRNCIYFSSTKVDGQVPTDFNSTLPELTNNFTINFSRNINILLELASKFNYENDVDSIRYYFINNVKNTNADLKGILLTRDIFYYFYDNFDKLVNETFHSLEQNSVKKIEEFLLTKGLRMSDCVKDLATARK